MSDPIRTFRHFRDVPQDLWRWKNFSPAEIACRGTGQLKLHPGALDKLRALRDRLGKPLIVRSAYRSPEHNRAVGGAPHSKHMDGTAFDIAMANHDPLAFEAAAREVGFLGFGFYPRSGFMHIDLGPARVWGARFPLRAVPFAAEAAPAREALAKSRTLKGTGAAGVATVGAAGVDVAQNVLAETQTAILPLVPYLDTLRWVFIAAPPNGWKIWSAHMQFTDRCWMLPRVALGIAMICLSACARAGFEGPHGACPPVVAYSRAEQARVADEISALQEGALILEWMADYAVLRTQARACR